MTTQEYAEVLSEHLALEFEAERLYTTSAHYFRIMNLEGFAKWCETHAAEEREHASRIFKFAEDIGATLDMRAAVPIPSPPSVINALHTINAHERKLQEAFHIVYETAKNVNYISPEVTESSLKRIIPDPRFQEFLGWFVREQVEEVSETQRLLDQALEVRDDPGALQALSRSLE